MFLVFVDLSHNRAKARLFNYHFRRTFQAKQAKRIWPGVYEVHSKQTLEKVLELAERCGAKVQVYKAKEVKP